MDARINTKQIMVLMTRVILKCRRIITLYQTKQFYLDLNHHIIYAFSSHCRWRIVFIDSKKKYEYKTLYFLCDSVAGHLVSLQSLSKTCIYKSLV